LACEHCFEWDALNRKETLDTAALREILARFLDQGVAQVQFSGGEPMRRFVDLLGLVEMARNRADTWIITSGAGLTAEKAAALKRAGLTGVLLSLDDWEPERHNRFRGSPHAFAGAETAAAAATGQGLILALSLCPTRAFVTPENLAAYANLGKRWGAGFIQIAEPKAVGHYSGRDVELAPAHIALLERFHLDLSYSPAYRDHPSSAYQGFAQRREGCGGAARRYLYVDTDGRAQACPFCRRPGGAGDCRQDSLSDLKDRLRESGCSRFLEPKNGHISLI
jgi:MoaA/NifB/PqqE/SkfB family radical SAM enzyme